LSLDQQHLPESYHGSISFCLELLSNSVAPFSEREQLHPAASSVSVKSSLLLLC
jgi:hypothetical protein